MGNEGHNGMNHPRIHQLPPSVVTKIAAGEVIERPASVVKELLENSVDAGASRIDIDIENGGIELIRVVDNGCGIVEHDLPLAFASHATSKIENADDLFRIGTLGFRGEALASIAGVAQVTLQSRPLIQPTGAEFSSHGGELSPVRAWNGTAGTRIEVRHLFYNTPVRRKFLRTTATEMGHICEVFTRLALAHTELHLVLRHNGKDVYEVPSSAGLLERLGLFFGAEVRDQIYAIDSRHGSIRIHGFIANPACERGTAKMQYLFVNGRWIRDRSLSHALQEGYRGLLMTGRYAVAFLFLELPPDQVDVNVHPTKVEVRFRDTQAMHHLVFGSVRDRLRAENLTSRLQVPPAGRGQWDTVAPLLSRQPAALHEPLWRRPDSAPAPRGERGAPLSTGGNRSAYTPNSNESTALGVGSAHAIDNGSGTEDKADGQQPVGLSSDEHSTNLDRPANGSTSRLEASNQFKAIQLYNSYVVVETDEGMLVIDQHALHERILFEQLKGRIRAGTLEIQRLLIPEPVEFTPDQAARALEHRDSLAELGISIEDFGSGTLLLSSYPAILGKRPPEETLRLVVDHLVAKDRVPDREQLLSDLLSLMACHGAVKAGDHLTAEEMAALVAERELARDTHHCPHGRPTALLFSRQELDRQFRRT
jgi:DNA mismatch repair protein MutL